MESKKLNLYIIAGCNGAGKTSMATHILSPDLDAIEFVNADQIAADLSPGKPEKSAFKAGRMMLTRIHQLIDLKVSFAFETTLSSKNYLHLIEKARQNSYKVTLIFLWLKSPQKAIERVRTRVEKGGHNIPKDVIERRYVRGISNLFKLYIPCCDKTLLFDSNTNNLKRIAEKELHKNLQIIAPKKLSQMMEFLSEPETVYMSSHETLIMQAVAKHNKMLLEETIRANSYLLVEDDKGVFRKKYADELRREYEAEYGSMSEN